MTDAPYTTYQDFAKKALAIIEKDIDGVLDWVDLPAILKDACRHAMGAGGKRMRPLLVLATYCALGGCLEQDSEAFKIARRAALAVELLHGYSLVHDDLPCMDDDDLRRGKPTCHVVYGEAVALLAGDVLQSLSFEVLGAPLPNFLPVSEMAGRLSEVFAPRARRMVAGQTLDMLGENQALTQSQLEAIHKDKTGALIEASVLMGALCGGADKAMQLALYEFAVALGLAFQVQDDVLDVVADTQTLGKPAGSDEKLQKSTFVRLLGVEGARAYAKALFGQTHQALDRLDAALMERVPNADSRTAQLAALRALTAWLEKRER